MPESNQIAPEKSRRNSFWRDFCAFINRGNVVDLAVGVVIGGSFGKIVSGLVTDILTPALSFLSGGRSLTGTLKTVLTPAVSDGNGNVTVSEVAILWGNWLQTVLDFLLTAFFIFLFLRLLARGRAILEAEKRRMEAEAKAESARLAAITEAQTKADAALLRERKAKVEESLFTQEKLLTDIRNLLRVGNKNR